MNDSSPVVRWQRKGYKGTHGSRRYVRWLTCNMFPVPAANNIINGSAADTELAGHCGPTVDRVIRDVSSANLRNLIFGELGVGTSLSMRITPLTGSIAIVRKGVALKKMTGVYTGRIVAFVKHELLRPNAVGKKPRNMGDVYELPARTTLGHLAIATLVLGTEPKPAFVRPCLSDFRPEPIGKRRAMGPTPCPITREGAEPQVRLRRLDGERGGAVLARQQDCGRLTRHELDLLRRSGDCRASGGSSHAGAFATPIIPNSPKFRGERRAA